MLSTLKPYNYLPGQTRPSLLSVEHTPISAFCNVFNSLSSVKGVFFLRFNILYFRSRFDFDVKFLYATRVDKG